MKRLSKKAKKPVQDNYNGIPIADLWDMDMTLTRLIANKLPAFLKARVLLLIKLEKKKQEPLG